MFFDILQGLEDLGFTQGFSGASDINLCFGYLGIVREIIQYVSEAKEIPFAYSIPCFPVIKDRKLTPSFLQTGEEPPGEHIPTWLPTFLDPHTYLQSRIQDEKTMDPCANDIQNARQHKNLRMPSPNIQLQLACNGSKGRLSKKPVENNPFLVAPVLSEEKELSPLDRPTKLLDGRLAGENHASVLETFAPAIEAVKLQLSDAVEGQNKVLLNQIPAVQFKIGVGRKSFGFDMDLSLQNKGVEKIGLWLGKDSEKDDKKKEGRENSEGIYGNYPQELAQL